MIARPVPKRINGMRLPILVCVLSEIAPNSGSRNSASTLSAAIIAPEYVSLRWNVLVSISGTMLLYICQNAQMDRNARPVNIVRLLSSFIFSAHPPGWFCHDYTTRLHILHLFFQRRIEAATNTVIA